MFTRSLFVALACTSLTFSHMPLAHASGTLHVGDSLSLGSTQLTIQHLESCAPSVEPFARSEFFTSSMPGFQCSTRDQLESFLEVTRLAVEGASLAALCTGVGAPVTILLAGGAFVTHAAQIVVGGMPCDDSANEAAVSAQVKRTVCEVLIAKGVECNPDEL